MYECTGKKIVSPLNLPKFNYSENAVIGLKAFFPSDSHLHDALETNDVAAWDMVFSKVKQLNELFALLSESGFPVR